MAKNTHGLKPKTTADWMLYSTLFIIIGAIAKSWAAVITGLAVLCLASAWRQTHDKTRLTINPLATGTQQQQTTNIRRPLTEAVRHEVWRRDQGRCVDCGSRERLEFDHIVPVSKGGSSTVRNIAIRCEHCNRSKGARI